MSLGELIMGKKINEDLIKKKNDNNIQPSQSEAHLSITKVSSTPHYEKASNSGKMTKTSTPSVPVSMSNSHLLKK